MPFQEKSAWVMSLSLLLGGLFYFAAATKLSADIGQLASPILTDIAVYTLILVIAAIIGHIAIAIFSPGDANAPLDEREQKILDRAGHVSSIALEVGAVLSLGMYFLSHNGDVLFYGVLASLMIGQLAEYGTRIYLYRFSV